MITIVYSTRKENPVFQEELKKTIGVKKYQVLEYVNDGEYSLTELYNKGLKEAENDIVVFCHDDIYFDKKNWANKIFKSFKRNEDVGIIGIAGSKHLPKSAKWWEVPQTMVGVVNHEHEGKKWVNNYSNNLGNRLDDVVIVDGLFFAVHKGRIKETFNEEVKGFHFYDVDFCFRNLMAGVKLGVTYEVRVTHRSIGVTNEEWEKNREVFAKRHKDHLPQTLIKSNIDTYIFVHDINILNRLKKSGKFNQFSNLKYVFLGDGECNDYGYDDLIVARDLEYNIEEYPKFTAFSGWYALWKNGLLNTGRHVLLLEYDVHLKEDFELHLNRLVEGGVPMVSFLPLTMRNYHFIDNPNWVNSINNGIRNVYNVDIIGSLKRYIEFSLSKGVDPMWMTTNNVMFSYDNLNEYLKWFEPLIDYVKDDINCGHAQERCLTFYAFMRGVKFYFAPNILKHEQLDSHGTQGHSVDFDEAIDRLENYEENNKF